MNDLDKAKKEFEEKQALDTKGTIPENAIITRQSAVEVMMNPVTFSQMQRAAQLFAASKLVPSHFQGDLASCFVAIQLAHQLEINPFMLMQYIYVVHGKPGFEGKLVIAMINSRGPFDGPIEWEFKGERFEPDWTCTAYATLKGSGKRCDMSVDWATVCLEGWEAPKYSRNTKEEIPSKWRTMPELMFRYRSATWLARAYCPEVLMGMQTTDEIEDVGGEPDHVSVEIVDSKENDIPDLDKLRRSKQETKPEEEPTNGKKVQVKDETKPPKRKRGKNRAVTPEDVTEIIGCAIDSGAVPAELADEELTEAVLGLAREFVQYDLQTIGGLTVGEKDGFIKSLSKDGQKE